MSAPAAAVALVPIDQDTVRAVCDLPLADGQDTFVAPAATTIAEAHYEPDAWLRAVTVAGEPVGVVLLVRDEPAEPYLLVRLMIAAGRQREGIGRRAVELVVDHLRSSAGSTLLRTSCVPGPGTPIPFYLGLGFRETGETDEDGEVLLELAPR